MIGKRAGYSGPFSFGGKRQCFSDRQLAAVDPRPLPNFGPDLVEGP
jgi:hypothetical protein